MTREPEINVFGEAIVECGSDPMTGFYRDGCCSTGPDDLGSHTVCAVVSEAFLAQQREVGNDLISPRPEYRFPGLKPGDRWCVCAARWLQAHEAGVAPPLVLAATHQAATRIVPLEILQAYAADVPDDPGALT